MKFFNKAVLFAFQSSIMTLALSAQQGENPMWENVSAKEVRALPILEESFVAPASLAMEIPSSSVKNAPASVESAAVQNRLLSVPTISDEIQELAKALNYEPISLYNWVRNNIDYNHYFGILKGAELTMLEGSGNDFDQCLLLAELLYASGANTTDVRFMMGRHRMSVVHPSGISVYGLLDLDENPVPDFTFEEAFGFPLWEDWTGITEKQAKQAQFAVEFLRARGTDVVRTSNGPLNLSFTRVWLEVDVEGVTYRLDPSFKTYDHVEGLSFFEDSAYSRDEILLSDSSGRLSSRDDYAKRISRSRIENYLRILSSDIRDEISVDFSNLPIEEVLSGRILVKHDISDLSQAFPMGEIHSTINDLRNVTQELDAYKSQFQFSAPGFYYETATSDLRGRKITLSFDGEYVELSLDDGDHIERAALSFRGSNELEVTLTLTHPGGRIDDRSETKTYIRDDNFMYTIIYGFNPSGRLLAKRHDILSSYLSAGKSDSSPEVRSETLNIMGLTWLYQTELIDQLLVRQNDSTKIDHHRFGRVAQEEGFYIDVGLQLVNVFPRDGVFYGRNDSVFQVGSLFSSALEHAIIEQMQPNASAVSTVNIIRSANDDNQNIYFADQGNWEEIRALLSNYSTNSLDTISARINQNNAKVLLPADASITQGVWSGSGYIARSDTQAGMIISGGYSGGYSTDESEVTSSSVVFLNNTNPISNQQPTASLAPLTPVSSTTPRLFSHDPVDMQTGAFYLEKTDIETGMAGMPRGLVFSRDYRSNAATKDSQNLGYGWTHNLHIRAEERTAIEETLGSGSAEQAVALIAATLVASDLYRENASPREWVIATLAAGWFTDQWLNNAVSVTHGKDIFQFIRQPDGSYTPPIGQTATLRKVDGKFELEQRLGNTIYFDSQGRAERIVDPDGKAMTFTYLSGDRVSHVEDAYGRRLTFYYTEHRINSVNCSTGRSVTYQYDSEGNLIRVTDPEGKHSHYIYEAATDPDGSLPVDPSATEDSEHLIVRLRNHDKEIIVQNIYDTLGRVSEQYLHGDVNKTWKLRYTGFCNTEEDPEGGIKCFYYDDRGRATGVRDQVGNLSSWEYDGQDHIVKRTSAAGEVTNYIFDGDHNLLRVDHPRGGGSTINEYDSRHRLKKTTDPEGHVTEMIYGGGYESDKNRPYQIIDPHGTTTFSYHSSGAGAGLVHTITDGDGFVTEHAYDSYGQPDWVKAPGGFTTDFSYSARGDLMEEVSPRGIRTANVFNDRRQVISTTRDKNGADQIQEDLSYDNQGLLFTTQAPAHNDGQRVETRMEYTPTNRIDLECLVNETATLADDVVSDYEYDGREFNVAIKDASDRQVDYNFFGNGQLQKMTHSGGIAGRNSVFTYDADNRPLTQSDPGAPDARNSSFAYGVSSLAEGDFSEGYPKTTFTDPLGETAISEFDRLGQLRFYTNTRNYLFEFKYDGLRRQTEIITPEGNKTTISYYHRGVPQQITEPSGQTTTFDYNATSGRLESQTDALGTISYTAYDDDGNLLSLEEGGKTITREYDNLNRVTRYVDSVGNELNYVYYDSGKLHKLVYPGGSASGVGHVEYTYWKTGRLKQVIDHLSSATTPRITQYTWRHDGLLERVERPNGTERVITYDSAGRPETIEELTSTGKVIVTYDLSYFDSDEIRTLTTLSEVDVDQIDGSSSLSFTYDGDNRLATYQRPYYRGEQIHSAVHDADGNMTFGPDANGVPVAYSFDARNRLTAMDGTTYTYDAENIRTEVTENGQAVTFVTDPHGSLSRILSRTRGGATIQYVYGIGLLYEVNASGGATYYHYDQVGNTAALTNDTELVVDQFRYSPYGSLVYQENSVDTPFLFGGFYGVHTDANGLIQMRARYYNPLIRRFINSDPARDQWNWFAYAGGNPISKNDPSGEVANFVIGAAIGFSIEYSVSVLDNLSEGQALGDALVPSQQQLVSIGISTVTGSLTGGIGGSLSYQGARTVGQFTYNASVNGTVNAIGGSGSQIVRNAVSGDDLSHNVAEAGAFGLFTGAAGSVAGDYLSALSRSASSRLHYDSALLEKPLSQRLPSPLFTARNQSSSSSSSGATFSALISNLPMRSPVSNLPK